MPCWAGPGVVRLIITDNDPQPSVQFASTSYGVRENAGSAMITAMLNAPSGRSVTVKYATGSGSATAGEDYTPVSGTLSFAAGSGRQDVPSTYHPTTSRLN